MYLVHELIVFEIENCLGPPEERPRPSGNPCVPSPCGPLSDCRVVGDSPACSCLPNYIGRAPNCRPECVISAECSANKACINQRCSDPCVGACGVHTLCTVLNHNSVCQCDQGYTGDPFTSCTEIPQRKTLHFSLYLSNLSALFLTPSLTFSVFDSNPISGGNTLVTL